MSREALVEEIVTHDCYRVRPWISIVKPDVLDLGANIGVFTMMCAEAGCRVYAVEPDPRAYAELKVLEALPSSNVQTFNGAVGAIYEKRRLFQALASQQSMLYASDNPSIEVDCRTIRHYRYMSGFAHEPRTQLLKLDIEGAEREIFYDADVLASFDVIVMEWHNHDGLLYKRILESIPGSSFDTQIAGGGDPPPKYHPMIGGGLLWACNHRSMHREIITAAWPTWDGDAG